MKKAQSKAKEPVTIRFKELANGNKSIYLDIYRDGKRTYQFLKLYLVPVKTAFDKANNANALTAANVIKADLIKKIANGEADIKIDSKMKISEYWHKYTQKPNLSKSTKISYKYALKAILEFSGDIQLRQIDKDYCINFCSFLCDRYKSTTANLNSIIFSGILNKAKKDGLIKNNPFSELDETEKIKPEAVEREYLTIGEVKRLAQTPMRNKKFDTKKAFLFSCMTGLRISDIIKLTWADVTTDTNGATRIHGIMQKTNEQFSNKISDDAVKLLPERNGKTDTDKVFKLQHRSSIDRNLKTWAKAAGITKNVSFHTARHTFATMLLTQGADLYTVSKLLGHSDISTTQIYAKIIDKKKDEAMSLLNNIL